MKKWKDNRGVIMVEASIYFPIAIFTVFAMIYYGMMKYQESILAFEVQKMATIGAREAAYPGYEVFAEDGSLLSAAVDFKPGTDFNSKVKDYYAAYSEQLYDEWKFSFDEYEVSAHLQGTMVLPCSVTLKPVNVPFDVEMEQNVSDFIEETGEKSIICENTLDIFPIIWENILMEIPMKVVSDDISDRTLSGNGWKVISGNEQTETNPELEKLKDLL